MVTSTMGSDLHSDRQDKLLKLQGRKKELEQLVAAKNEELYILCVQEVQLTGIMPPETPLSPELPRERLGSVKSVERSTDGNDVQDGCDTGSRRLRTDRGSDADQNLRKNLSHRLSTPSISGMSSKSALSRHTRRPDTSWSNFFPSPPQERNTDTFSMHTSHTYPSLTARHDIAPNPVESQHTLANGPQTMTTEYMNKIYFTNTPETLNVSRLRETHFSSSHPDITTHYTHGNVAPYQASSNGIRNTPLVYQYASHLKAQSQHLGTLAHHHQMQNQSKRGVEGNRRNSLQRTQTYHLTSHSDYNQHLENIGHQHRSQPDFQEQRSPMPVERAVPVPNTLPLRERNTIRNAINMPLQVSTEDYMREDRRGYPDAMSPVSQISGHSQSNFDAGSVSNFSPVSQVEMKPKQKHWYETSLDSPTKEILSPKKISNLKRTSSVGNAAQTYEIMMSSGRHSAMLSPNQPARSPLIMSPSAVEPPKNLTVIEQGKCIPYREESKPFEMSDFYKYSTKFRQAKGPAPAPVPSTGYNKLPMELPPYAQDHWQGQTN